MKRVGLSLVSISLLIVTFVVFQNCSDFTAATGGSSSQASLALPPFANCTSGASQSCAVSNGTGAQICSNNIWSPCVTMSCVSGFTLTDGACVSSGGGGSALACQGTFSFFLAGSATPIVIVATETAAGAVTLTVSGTAIGSGTCSVGGTSGNANFSFIYSGNPANCSGLYTVANSKTQINNGVCTYAGGTIPFTAAEN